jgi:hypothetical protein
MLRTTGPTCRILLSHARSLHNVSGSGLGSSIPEQSHPNAPLEIDPTLRALLNDVDMSLVRHKSHHLPRVYRELEAQPIEQSLDGRDPTGDEDFYEDDTTGRRDARKSPAADFGSQKIGAVTLPFELQKSISRLISGKKWSRF